MNLTVNGLNRMRAASTMLLEAVQNLSAGGTVRANMLALPKIISELQAVWAEAIQDEHR